MQNLKGAIFDMDGVLFDTEMLYQKYWREVAAERGIELDDSFTQAISGTSGEAMQNIIMRYYQVQDKEMALAIETDCKRRVRNSLYEYVPVKKGVREILEFLQQQGVKIAIASSSDRDQIQHNIQSAGVASYFDVIVSGAEVKAGKPAPDIFLQAAKHLGQSPEDCVVFEDSENGVRSGHAATCYTIMIPDVVQPSKEIISLCNYIAGDLLEVKEHLNEKFFS